MALEETIDVDRETAYRDRTIVYLLDGTGARGAELFADSKDSARNGVTWGDLNYDEQYLEVYGKSGDFEEAPLPESIHDVLERWRRVLEPKNDAWPIVPTGHYLSRRTALEDELGEARVESELALAGDETNPEAVDRLLHEHDVPPPALSKEGARRVVKQLSEEAGIDPDGDYDYLTMHGARRALGRDLYAAGRPNTPRRHYVTSPSRRPTSPTRNSKRKIRRRVSTRCESRTGSRYTYRGHCSTCGYHREFLEKPKAKQA